jgi:hypothetical protein
LNANDMKSHFKQMGRDIGVQLGKTMEQGETKVLEFVAERAIELGYESADSFLNDHEVGKEYLPADAENGLVERVAFIFGNPIKRQVELAYILEGGYTLNGVDAEGKLDVETFCRVAEASHMFSYGKQ